VKIVSQVQEDEVTVEFLFAEINSDQGQLLKKIINLIQVVINVRRQEHISFAEKTRTYMVNRG
jgi:hypothetical protein